MISINCCLLLNHQPSTIDLYRHPSQQRQQQHIDILNNNIVRNLIVRKSAASDNDEAVASLTKAAGDGDVLRVKAV